MGGNVAHVDTEAVGVHDGGGVADDNFGRLNFFSEQHHPGGAVSDKSDNNITARLREQAQAELGLLIGLEIDTEQGRALIYWGAVNGSGCFVNCVNSADQCDGFAVGLCELPDNASNVCHKSNKSNNFNNQATRRPRVISLLIVDYRGCKAT